MAREERLDDIREQGRKQERYRRKIKAGAGEKGMLPA